jgi:post-segregation antitoxin (ccd killing protein)
LPYIAVVTISTIARNAIAAVPTVTTRLANLSRNSTLLLSATVDATLASDTRNRTASAHKMETSRIADGVAMVRSKDCHDDPSILILDREKRKPIKPAKVAMGNMPFKKTLNVLLRPRSCIEIMPAEGRHFIIARSPFLVTPST